MITIAVSVVDPHLLDHGLASFAISESILLMYVIHESKNCKFESPSRTNNKEIDSR